jgi:hypothetical protein
MLDLRYQDAYRNFREYAKECHEAVMGVGAGQQKVDAELYSDLKRGEVQIYTLGMLGPNHLFRVDFEEIGPSKTRMTVKKLIPAFISWEAKFIEVANGRRQGC